MKRILVLNNINTRTSFDVAYSIPNSTKVTTITSFPFISQIFRIIEIPENAINITVTMQTIDAKDKKTLVRKETLNKAVNICYEIYQGVSKIEAKTVACQKFQGAYSISGINKTSTIIRAKIVYTLNGIAKTYVLNSVKKDISFGILIPVNAKKIKIQIDKSVDVKKDIWANIYTESFSDSSVPKQKCYSITKPLLRDIKCSSIDCLKL